MGSEISDDLFGDLCDLLRLYELSDTDEDLKEISQGSLVRHGICSSMACTELRRRDILRRLTTDGK